MKMNTCTSCGMIEGFENDSPMNPLEEVVPEDIQDFIPPIFGGDNIQQNQQMRRIPIVQSPSPVSQQVHGYIRGSHQTEQPQGDFMPFMKSQCSYAAQPCMYSAQGTLICPKKDLGSCKGEPVVEQFFMRSHRDQ